MCPAFSCLQCGKANRYLDAYSIRLKLFEGKGLVTLTNSMVLKVLEVMWIKFSGYDVCTCSLRGYALPLSKHSPADKAISRLLSGARLQSSLFHQSLPCRT